MDEKVEGKKMKKKIHARRSARTSSMFDSLSRDLLGSGDDGRVGWTLGEGSSRDSGEHEAAELELSLGRARVKLRTRTWTSGHAAIRIHTHHSALQLTGPTVLSLS